MKWSCNTLIKDDWCNPAQWSDFNFHWYRIVNHFINFILKRTEGGATVDFIITLLTSSIAENHNFTTGYSLGWRHLSLKNKFGIKKIKLVTILEWMIYGEDRRQQTSSTTCKYIIVFYLFIFHVTYWFHENSLEISIMFVVWWPISP